MAHVVYQVLETVRMIGVMISPFMPGKAAELRHQLGLDPLMPTHDLDLWPSVFGALTPETQTRPGQALFPRLDKEQGQAALAKLGAKRLLPRVDCDVDFEKLAKTWSDDALARVREVADKFKPAGGPASTAAPAVAAAPAIAELKREQPATAEVLANQRIVGRGALREVRHVELSFPGLGNLYKPGDALGIVHRNPEPAIEAVLKATKLDAAASVTHEGKTHTLLEWLRDERELTRIARPLLTAVADRSKADLSELLDPRNPAALTRLTATAQVADVLAKYPAEWTPEALVAALRPVHGRVYSIASSPAAVGDEAHLTVAVVGSDTDRKLAAGAASHFVPLHASPYGRKVGRSPALPRTERLAASLVRLPIYPTLGSGEQERVIEEVSAACRTA